MDSEWSRNLVVKPHTKLPVCWICTHPHADPFVMNGAFLRACEACVRTFGPYPPYNLKFQTAGEERE